MNANPTQVRRIRNRVASAGLKGRAAAAAVRARLKQSAQSRQRSGGAAARSMRALASYEQANVLPNLPRRVPADPDHVDPLPNGLDSYAEWASGRTGGANGGNGGPASNLDSLAQIAVGYETHHTAPSAFRHAMLPTVVPGIAHGKYIPTRGVVRGSFTVAAGDKAWIFPSPYCRQALMTAADTAPAGATLFYDKGGLYTTADHADTWTNGTLTVTPQSFVGVDPRTLAGAATFDAATFQFTGGDIKFEVSATYDGTALVRTVGQREYPRTFGNVALIQSTDGAGSAIRGGYKKFNPSTLSEAAFDNVVADIVPGNNKEHFHLPVRDTQRMFINISDQLNDAAPTNHEFSNGDPVYGSILAGMSCAEVEASSGTVTVVYEAVFDYAVLITATSGLTSLAAELPEDHSSPASEEAGGYSGKGISRHMAALSALAKTPQHAHSAISAVALSRLPPTTHATTTILEPHHTDPNDDKHKDRWKWAKKILGVADWMASVSDRASKLALAAGRPGVAAALKTAGMAERRLSAGIRGLVGW